MECPECGRWWKYREQYQDAADKWADHYGWFPVSRLDVKARRRIAVHETALMHQRSPTTIGDLHWWHVNVNPRRK